MEMISRFKFHPVGQGCFYTGKIFSTPFRRSSKFNMVYDCGSSFDKEHLYQQIEEYKNELYRNKLDVLFISHLDNDHVNGITRLLKELKCNQIYLPYLAPIDRLYVALRFILGRDEDSDGSDAPDYLSFLQSPEEYLLNEGQFNVKQLIYINGNDDEINFNQYDEIQKNPNEPNNEEPELLNRLSDDNSEDSEIVAIKEKHTQKVNFKKGNGILLLNNIWEFYLYYNRSTRINEEELKQSIKLIYNIDINNPLTQEQLVKILSDNAKLSKLKKAFNQPRSAINTSGLLLMHKPINYKYAEIHRENHYSYVSSSKYSSRFFPRSFNSKTIRNKNNNWGITLLTGDTCLNQINNSIYIETSKKNVLVFQVPHHGSKTGWDDGKNLDDLNNKGMTDVIINFGYGNHYGHPKSRIISDLIDNNFQIFYCTQFEQYNYLFQINFH